MKKQYGNLQIIAESKLQETADDTMMDLVKELLDEKGHSYEDKSRDVLLINVRRFQRGEGEERVELRHKREPAKMVDAYTGEIITSSIYTVDDIMNIIHDISMGGIESVKR